jgi:hypothetical protein
VFLSYCREDREAAQRIRDALDIAGIDVWFDERNLEAGDEFERLIASQIAKSVFFVAVVSRHWLAAGPRFIRFEWREAESHAKKAPFDVPFVIPVSIDETSPSDERLPALLRRLNWSDAPRGELQRSFIDTLVRNYRAIQRATSAV